jgi:hypothetical protein
MSNSEARARLSVIIAMLGDFPNNRSITLDSHNVAWLIEQLEQAWKREDDMRNHISALMNDNPNKFKMELANE